MARKLLIARGVLFPFHPGVNPMRVVVLSILALTLVTPSAYAFDDGDEEIEIEGLERGTVKKTDDKKKKEAASGPVLPDLDEEPVEEFDEEEDGLEDEPDEDIQLGDFEGDEPLEDFDGPSKPKTATVAKVATPGVITLDVAGKEPLADNYALTVVAVDRDAVVVELPVLVARARAGFEKPFLLIGEVYVGKTKVGEVRQTVEAASLAEFGPSFAWMKVLAPVVDNTGDVKIVVKKANVDGTGATELFSRVTPYALR
jgi:hypothetical protein